MNMAPMALRTINYFLKKRFHDIMRIPKLFNSRQPVRDVPPFTEVDPGSRRMAGAFGVAEDKSKVANFG